MSSDRQQLGKWIQLGLLALGLSCLSWSGFESLRADRYQRLHKETFQTTQAVPASIAAPTKIATGTVIGTLDIPRLGISAVVAEGDDDATLAVAIGHLPDTPLPWLTGNTALAAHRDTFFRPLKHIRIGDALSLSTPHGVRRYRVIETMVVEPEDLRVLDPTDRPTLTLITCYPFNYIGSAPRRFIVRAEALPESAADPDVDGAASGTPASDLSASTAVLRSA